jgi:hypothetical protein
MGSGTVVEAVPTAGLTENFSARSVMAPPPLLCRHSGQEGSRPLQAAVVVALKPRFLGIPPGPARVHGPVQGSCGIGC